MAQKILAARQTTTIGEAGKTGTWRTIRPVLIPEKCLVVKSGKPTCHKCWLYCPEATVSRSIPPVFDYDYCKGCGICATECPTEAIQMVPEKEAPSCAETIANAGGNADA
ncbi:4Fe-4S binding protein [bacterium]|nr:4Fe-4S binding protein [candidate division CSSED10-310 bacterium]